uniref:Uncharacterized protein n=1 Tax=Megaselia scalaris TaxID=36166 RepID=T1GGB6_MEGSC
PIIQNNRPNKKKGFKNKPNKKPNQSSDVPVADFDYKSANFNMFKGGAQKVQGTQLKNGKFQAKARQKHQKCSGVMLSTSCPRLPTNLETEILILFPWIPILGSKASKGLRYVKFTT